MTKAVSTQQHQTLEFVASEKQPIKPTSKASNQQERSNIFEKVKSQMPRTRSRSPNPTAIDTKCANMKGENQSPMERKPSSPSPTTAQHPKPPVKRNSTGTFSDCGRHSNDWLFNGFSVKETARGLLKRRDS